MAHSLLKSALALVLGASALPAAAQEPPASIAALCSTLEHKRYPEADRPTAAQKQALERNVDSRAYYYGIGVAVDYVKARYAAFAELESDIADIANASYGEIVLMMLYANGFGVKQDLDLATMLACRNGFAPAEFQGRVEHLQARKQRPERRPFDYCDDITSGYMMGLCEGLAEERRAAKRNRALDVLASAWPAEHVVALGKLKRAADAFIEARINHEVDLSGTARAMLMTREETRLRNALLNALKRFESGKLPAFDAASFKHADAQLNRVYKRAVAQDWEGSTVTAEGIRTVERSWIAYRDAWVHLGMVRYPSVAGHSWQTWLTRERTKQLQEFVPPR